MFAGHQDLKDSVRGLLARHWPIEARPGRDLDPDAIGVAWTALVEAGFDQLGHDRQLGGLAAAAATAFELGRAGCPAPFLQSYVANVAGAGTRGPDRPVAIAFPCDVSLEITPRSNAIHLSGEVRHVETSAIATDLLVLKNDEAIWCRLDAAGVVRTASPGLSRPTLETIGFDASPGESRPIDGGRVLHAEMAARLLFAARALGALDRAFELAVTHVRQREQFGQPLGRFQAMQHKLADVRTILEAARLVIETAVAEHDLDAADATMSGDLAVAFCCQRLRHAMLEVQHSFGAGGLRRGTRSTGSFSPRPCRPAAPGWPAPCTLAGRGGAG